MTKRTFILDIESYDDLRPLLSSNFFPVTDDRPDIQEYDCEVSPTHEGTKHFILKAHGEVLTNRASEALSWALERFRCTRQESIARNCTFLRFEREQDAVLFKMFWL